MIFITRVFCGSYYINMTYTLTSVRNRKGKRVVYVNNLK